MQDIFVLHELQGLSVDEILEGYPQLSPAKAYSALAYYWDHREEIDAQMQATDDLVERLKQEQGPSALQRKLAKRLNWKLGQHIDFARSAARQEPRPPTFS